VRVCLAWRVSCVRLCHVVCVLVVVRLCRVSCRACVCAACPDCSNAFLSIRFKGLTQEERLVYSLIEKEGNMGTHTPRSLSLTTNTRQALIPISLRAHVRWCVCACT
jgi:hypothetical protein